MGGKMDFTNIFIIIFLAGTALDFLLDYTLEYIDFKYREKNGRKIPSELEGHIDEATLDKTCRYEDALYKLWVPKNIVSKAVTLTLLFTGFYPFVFENLWNLTGSSFFSLWALMIIVTIPESILTLPFELYGEFKIEKKFGFSTMTVKLWILDQIKSFILSLIISAILVFAVVFVLQKCGDIWWILMAAVFLGFTLLISIIYPMFIAPLFNKFSPLEQGELRTRLEGLLVKCGFKSNGLFVMDASKRSKHSNAYFTGFGKAKRVVLYDTLIEQLSQEEIEAVLAHELGHYHYHHVAKKLFISVPLILAGLFFISLFINTPLLYEGFGFDVSQGVQPHMKGIGLILLNLVFGGFSTLLSPLTNHFSRRDEFQADAWSKKLCGSGKPLSQALIKLNKENLSEITPPKIYSIFNYSHPPLLERIRAVEEK